MTEDEAKTKMCCGPLHFSSTDPNGQRCIGSACMAWRQTFGGGDVVEADIKWLTKPKGETNPPFSNAPEGYRVTSHDSFGWYTVRRDEVIGHEAATGFCGLAGTPQ